MKFPYKVQCKVLDEGQPKDERARERESNVGTNTALNVSTYNAEKHYGF